MNFEFRMHDPRVGRFFAVDPLASKYPWYSSYQFSGNKVIDHIELEGLEEGDPLTNGYIIPQKPVLDAPNFICGADNFCHNVMATMSNTLTTIYNGTIVNGVNSTYSSIKKGENGTDIVFNWFDSFSNQLEQLRDESKQAANNPGDFVYNTFTNINNYSNALAFLATWRGGSKCLKVKELQSVNVNPKLKQLKIVGSAETKFKNRLADKFEMSNEDLFDHVDNNSKRYIDKNNDNNINIIADRPDGKTSSCIRITLSPDGKRIISAGLIKKKDIDKGISSNRFIEKE